MKIIHICLLWICVISVSIADTSGADFLFVPDDSVSASHAGAILADYSGPHTINGNPANIGRLEGIQLSLSHCFWLFDTSSESLQTVMGLPVGSAGISVNMQNYNNIAVRDSWGEILNEVQPIDLAAKGVYAITVAETPDIEITVGGGAQYIFRSIDDTLVNGVSFEAGGLFTYYHFNPETLSNKKQPFFNSLSVGLAVKNIGPDVGGDLMAYDIGLGVGASFFNNLSLLLDANITAAYPYSLSFGAEYLLYNMVRISGGVNFEQDIFNYAGGIGGLWKFNTNTLRADYAISIKKENGLVHIITLTYLFGKGNSK